jgi:hypothetical protein
MIGPGWMPSRPRPMNRGKRRLFSYRRRTRRGRERVPLVDLSHSYDGAPLPLPAAVLVSTGQLPRHRMLTGALERWLRERWLWLRPRSVPIVIAFAGMLAVLSAVKQLSVIRRCDMEPLTLAPAPQSHARHHSHGHHLIATPAADIPAVPATAPSAAAADEIAKQLAIVAETRALAELVDSLDRR